MDAIGATLRGTTIPHERDDFGRLVERHSRALYRTAYRMTGNAADADDVVQETFLRAYRYRDRFESPDGSSPWLFRIASNYAVDLLRRRNRWKQSEIDEAGGPLPSSAPDPDRLLRSDEISRTVQERMAALTPNERVAFTLRHYEGMPLKEIAEIMDIRVNAVKNHVFRAVRKMRAALGPLVESPRDADGESTR